MRGALLVFLLAIAVTGTASARSRDFSVPEPVQAAPLPRGPYYASLGIGFSYASTRWNALEAPTVSHDDGLSLGPDVRLAAGFMVRQRAALLLEGMGRAPVTVLGISMGGVGIGSRIFLGSAESSGFWHLEMAIRRSWMASVFTPVLEGHSGHRFFTNVWVAEIGAGHGERHARVDRAWALAAFGGVIGGDASGWTAGVGLTWSWARS